MYNIIKTNVFQTNNAQSSVIYDELKENLNLNLF